MSLVRILVQLNLIVKQLLRIRIALSANVSFERIHAARKTYAAQQ